MPSAVRRGEIIQIQVGKAGNGIGNAFWQKLLQEHKLDRDAEGRRDPSGYVDVFFDEVASGKAAAEYVPRAVLVDTNMTDLTAAAQDPALGDLLRRRPENVVGREACSGNSYAQVVAECSDLASQCVEAVRKEVERCNCIQGVQFCNAVSGGSGSGLSYLVSVALRDYLDKRSSCVNQSFALVPAPGMVDVVIEPYNACLALQGQLEYLDQVFLADNRALSRIYERAFGEEPRAVSDLNEILARCLSGVTSCLRFPSSPSTDLRKLQENLVPFKNSHFLANGLAPLNLSATERDMCTDARQLVQQVFCKDNLTVTCDPCHPGNDFEGILQSRFLAAWTSWQGPFASREVDQALHGFWRRGSLYAKHFPDWLPKPMAGSICHAPRAPEVGSVVSSFNNTGMAKVFARRVEAWDTLHASRAHVHAFEQDGISASELEESRNIVAYIRDAYNEFATLEAKIFEDCHSWQGRKVIRERAIDGDDQLQLAKQMQALDAEMYIKEDPRREQ